MLGHGTGPIGSVRLQWLSEWIDGDQWNALGEYRVQGSEWRCDLSQRGTADQWVAQLVRYDDGSEYVAAEYTWQAAEVPPIDAVTEWLIAQFLF